MDVATTSMDAVRMPAMMNGAAKGSSTVRSTSPPVSPMATAASRTSASTSRTPT